MGREGGVRREGGREGWGGVRREGGREGGVGEGGRERGEGGREGWGKGREGERGGERGGEVVDSIQLANVRTRQVSQPESLVGPLLISLSPRPAVWDFAVGGLCVARICS